MKYDNPAARLLAILEEGKLRTPADKCREVWCDLLDVSLSNNALLMSRLGKVMELPELAINELRDHYPNQEGTWDHWVKQVNKGFMTQNLNDQWAGFINHIDQHSINFLHLTSDLIEAKSKTTLISEQELDDARVTLVDLYDEVINSNISNEIKAYLARSLRRLIESIDEYKISGAMPLLDGIETTLGHSFINVEYKEFLRESEIGKRILTTLGAMADLVTVSIGLPQVSHSIQLLAQSYK